MYDQFETYETGRGSETHKKHLKKKIKTGLNTLRYNDISLEELNDEAEELIDEYKENPSDELADQLRLLQTYLDAYVEANK